MELCASCKKRMILRIIFTVLELKPSELARKLHVSESLVSKYLAGERKCIAIDRYLITKVFGIEIKDYILVNG